MAVTSFDDRFFYRFNVKNELVEKMRRKSSAAATSVNQTRKKTSIEDSLTTDDSMTKDSKNKRRSTNETIVLNTVDE